MHKYDESVKQEGDGNKSKSSNLQQPKSKGNSELGAARPVIDGLVSRGARLLISLLLLLPSLLCNVIHLESVFYDNVCEIDSP